MLSSRMPRELRLLSESPAPGIAAWPRDESCMTLLDARIAGPPGSPYEGGSFRLEVGVPDRYPFEPPKVKTGVVGRSRWIVARLQRCWMAR